MSNIRFSFVLILVLATVLFCLDQAIQIDLNNSMLDHLDYSDLQLNSLMQQLTIDTVSNYDDVNCLNLNKLDNKTLIDFNDKALMSKLELCHNYQ